jgi:parallel beta-helix repeat protein
MTLTKSIWSISLLFCLMVVGKAEGSTYYVAKTGKDTNACTSTAPCLTIQKAVSQAKLPGNTVIVKAGTYVEYVGTWSSGAKGKPIILKANPGETVIWRAPGSNPGGQNGTIQIVDRSFIRIEGFRFEGTVARSTIRARNTSTSKAVPVQGIEIVNNTFFKNGNNGGVSQSTARPIYFQNAGHNTFEAGDSVNTISGNTFDGNYGYNIQLLRSNDTVVSNNTCRNVKSSFEPSANVFIARFLQFGSGSVRNVIEGNVISNFVNDLAVGAGQYTATGIKLDAGANENIICRNVIHDLPLSAGGIQTESGCNYNQIYENRIYNVGGAGYQNGSSSTNVSIGNTWTNNVGYNCGCGMLLSKSKNIVIKNNIFSNNVKSQIQVSNFAVASGGHVISNNDYYKAGSTSIGLWNTTATGCTTSNKNLSDWNLASGDKNSLSVDPKHVTPPTNLHLHSGSSLRNKGEGGVDMGAYPGSPGPSLTLSQEGPVLLMNEVSASTQAGSASVSRAFAWRRALPESQGMDSAKLDMMLDALVSRDTQGLVIIRNDRIVAERYAPGHTSSQRHNVGSLAESLLGGMSLLVALSDGRIRPEDYAWKFIPGWRDNSQKSRIQIRHLASHTSGIEDASGPEEWKQAFWKRVVSPFSIAVNEAPTLFSPGNDFAYSNTGIAALTYALTASLRNGPERDIYTLLKKRIMDPIKVAENQWSIGHGKAPELDGMKLHAAWGGASYSTRAVAKLGRLMLRKGNWDGLQLTQASWVDRMVSSVAGQFDSGLCWWTNHNGQWPSLPRDAYAGGGAGHQVLLVVPSLNLVAVRLGHKLMDEQDFWLGLEEYLFVPLMRSLARL